MPLVIGEHLGPYHIVAPLGAGGMGEVYRAHDTRLRRDVALKILPAVFANDPDRLARFEREARMVALLDHPNIGAIHGVEESGGIRALVLALVEGPTLADRIAAGPLPPEEAASVALQIAEAFEYAHDRGVIHRDLKPANVKITPEGVVKVLDFGLAKALEGEEPVARPGTNSPTALPTVTIGATQPGMILGTAAYLSPEQVKGKRADRRSDIWAFGVVLYEMLTARRPFAGDSIGELLAGVVKDEPKLDGLPAPLRSLVARCLIKEPRKRLQSFGEARQLLDQPTAETESVPAEPARTRVAWPAVAAGVAVALAIGWAAGHFGGAAVEPQAVTLFLPPPENATFGSAALSPDGRHLAFHANSGGRTALWIRDMDALAARPLPGTAGVAGAFWSPDSRFIAFFADGKIKKISATGGPVTAICDAEAPRGGAWSASDVIVFAPRFGAGGLSRCPATGGAVTPLTTSENSDSHRFPWFLPDGQHFLYTARGRDPESTRVYVGDLASDARRVVLTANSNAIYASGYLFFMRGLTLVAQAFDVSTLETRGEEIPVAEQVNFDSLNIDGRFSVSEHVLAFLSGRVTLSAQLTWLDRSGRVVDVLGDPGPVRLPAISPAGDVVAFTRADAQTGTSDIWLRDLRRNTESRFVFHPQYSSSSPIWSADGTRMVYSSIRPGTGVIFQKSLGGPAPERPLLEDVLIEGLSNSPTVTDLSKDGRFIVGHFQSGKTREDIFILPQFGERTPIPYAQTEASEQGARLSPDGQWLAYVSDETKRNEVYVQSFPVPGVKFPVSANGGAFPAWSRDGTEIFFIDADSRMMAVDVKTVAQEGKPAFQAGVPKALFETQVNGRFDVSGDGRFLMPVPMEQSAAVPFTVVLNWQAALKK